MTSPWHNLRGVDKFRVKPLSKGMESRLGPEYVKLRNRYFATEYDYDLVFVDSKVREGKE